MGEAEALAPHPEFAEVVLTRPAVTDASRTVPAGAAGVIVDRFEARGTTASTVEFFDEDEGVAPVERSAMMAAIA